MNVGWRYVVSEEALVVVLRLGLKQRGPIIAALEELAARPHLNAPVADRDEAGRPLHQLVQADFRIIY